MKQWTIFTIPSSFLWVYVLNDIEVQMADWWNPISITFNDLVDPISLLFTTCLWHAARAVSFGSVRALRYARHVPRECKTQASCCIVKNVRYANAVGKVKKSCGPSFSAIVLNSTYPFVWARLFRPSEALRVPSPFNETFKRAYAVEYSSRKLLSFEC